MIVTVPASSANLGPGFDALGLALSLALDAGTVDAAGPVDGMPEGARLVDEHHPSMVAFRLAGGEGQLWVRSPIPMGRGLGFSGAARVAGLVVAHAQRACRAGEPFSIAAAAAEILARATSLEGHADNVAASLLGGLVASAGGRAVRIPLALDPAVVAWVPGFTTSTDASRGELTGSVDRADAVFNVGRVALLVAALATGDVDALRTATQDRLHQDIRLAHAGPSRRAMTAALDAGAWCAWLSGSGPTIALLCPVDQAPAIAAALPVDGHTKLLRVDHDGARVTGA